LQLEADVFLLWIGMALWAKDFCLKVAKDLYSDIQFSNFEMWSFLSQAREGCKM
jgi:hypothetical protein